MTYPDTLNIRIEALIQRMMIIADEMSFMAMSYLGSGSDEYEELDNMYEALNLELEVLLLIKEALN